jgi:hypothetical protein
MAYKIEVYVPQFAEDGETDLTETNLLLLDAINNRYGAVAQYSASVYRQGGNDEFNAWSVLADDLTAQDRTWWENRKTDWANLTGGHRSFQLFYYEVARV